jgi:propionate CoA-transferase
MHYVIKDTRFWAWAIKEISNMSVLFKANLLVRLLLWKHRNANMKLNWRPKIDNPKFMSAAQAVELIPDNAVGMSTGLAGSMRPAILFAAIRKRFEKVGHPANLTWIAAGGSGGRGMVPGTVEEVGVEGLCTRFISGHLETAKSLLKLGDKGVCELVVLPQGTITQLAEAQWHGQDSLVTTVGVGSFMDPRVGTGTQVIPGVGEQLVEVDGDKLRYRLPPITAACVIATAADEEGNLYIEGAPLICEAKDATLAAKANGGVALACVAKIVPKDESKIFLPADKVDAIVLHPTADMAIAIPLAKPWPEFLPGAKCDVKAAARRAKVMNQILKMDPERGPVDSMLARQTARLFAKVAKPKGTCIIGYGLPQEVGRLVEAGGLSDDVKFLVETGAYGGVPAPGLFFGMSVNPERLMTSAQMFTYCESNLDVTILGMLQADGEGNVNVSKKAPGARNYIGPGGFLNLVDSAKTIIFVGAFTAKGKVTLEDGKLTVVEKGIPKLVKEVDEITFSAKAALEAGKEVYYVTTVGAFKLTDKGLELFQVADGVDIEKDVKGCCEIDLIIPESVPVLDREIMTGEGFKLAFGN